MASEASINFFKLVRINFILICISFLAVNCASTKGIVTAKNLFNNTTTELNKKTCNYTKGKEQQCFVGDKIIEIENLSAQVTRNDVRFYRALRDIPQLSIQQGKIYIGAYTYNGHILLRTEKRFTAMTYIHTGYLAISSDGKLEDANIYGLRSQAENPLMGVSVILPAITNIAMLNFDIRPEQLENLNVGDKLFDETEPSDPNFLIQYPRFKRTILEAENNFKYELVYNGITSDAIRVSYREYTNNFARPAFYQDLTYDSKNNDIIRYKNIKIKIIKADNEKIRYIVLED